mmetsp:Transcript_8234/g.12727  ORF Transcript_8234/g.12727 Transcript_8234/m.12727 type:complete len:408 (-) Transcript_8234:131-1354(-)
MSLLQEDHIGAHQFNKMGDVRPEVFGAGRDSDQLTPSFDKQHHTIASSASTSATSVASTPSMTAEVNSSPPGATMMPTASSAMEQNESGEYTTRTLIAPSALQGRRTSSFPSNAVPTIDVPSVSMRRTAGPAVPAPVQVSSPIRGPPPEQPRARTSNFFLSQPPPLRREAWSETDATTFSVRGGNYLADGKKMNSPPSLFKLMAVDLVQSPVKLFRGMCSHPNERIQRALQREAQSGIRELPDFIFCVNIVVPGKSNYHLAIYMGLEDIAVLRDPNFACGRLMQKFFFGDSNEFRNETFKLIPRVVKGNIVVRKAVASKPAIIGKKLKQTYVRTDRFLELIIDIGSNSVAEKIVRVAKNFAKTLEVDMAFVLEGKEIEFLPEHVLGAVRLLNVDFKVQDGQRVVLPF